MPELNELEAKLQKAVEAVQKKADEVGAEQAKELEGVQKAIKDASDAVEAQQLEMQKEAGARAALENEVEEMKKRLARSVSGDAQGDEFKAYGEEFQRYLKKGIAVSDELVSECARGIVEKSLHGVDAEDMTRVIKDMVVGSDPRGGYLVRPEVSSSMITRIFETSPIRSVASVQTIASDSLEIIIDDNEAASGGWVGEVDSRAVTDTPQLGKLIIEAHEIFAQPRATQKMLDDAGVDVEAWLQRKVTDVISRAENTAFVLGDGSQKPRGLLNYADAASYGTYERGAIQTKTATGTAGALDNADDLKDLQNGLKEDYQGSAVWLMKRGTFGDVITLKDSQGQYLFQSRFINEMDRMVLIGKPVIFADDMPAVAANALAVAYGDFGRGYTVVDRTGFRVIRDPYTAKPYVLFYTTKRTGGDVTSYDSWNRLRINS